MYLLTAFGICIFVSHLSATSSLFFFRFPWSFPHHGYPPIHSDRTNDENNSLPHFPYFFSMFRHRTPSFWRDDFVVSSTQAPLVTRHLYFVRMERVVNATLNPKSNVTDTNLKKISTAIPEHHIEKKSELVPQSFNLWNKILKIKGADLITPRNDWRGAEGTQEANKNEAQQDDETLLMAISLNQTKGVAVNKSLEAYGANCTHHHHASRYFFFWTLHWAAMGFQVLVIVLLSCTILLGLFLCRYWVTDERSKLQIYKIKPLSI